MADDQAHAQDSGQGPPSRLRPRRAAPSGSRLRPQIRGRGEHAPRGCRSGRRPALQHALQPLARRGAARRHAHHPRRHRLATAARGHAPDPRRVVHAEGVDRTHPPAAQGRTRHTHRHRRPRHRGLRRDARRPRLRPPGRRGRSLHPQQPPHVAAGTPDLVVEPSHRDALDDPASRRLRRRARVRRLARPRWHAHARRRHDVLGLSAHAPWTPGVPQRQRDQHPGGTRLPGSHPRPARRAAGIHTTRRSGRRNDPRRPVSTARRAGPWRPWPHHLSGSLLCLSQARPDRGRAGVRPPRR